MQLTIASEDELSEAVLEQLAARNGQFQVVQRLRRGGWGYIKRITPGLNQAAVGHPYLVLVDLDTNNCPADLMKSFLGQSVKHRNLQFRVAVRAVESWLLADPAFVTSFLGLPAAHCPSRPDQLNDPKRELVSLAKKSRRAIRHDLVPMAGTSAKQGPNYNAPLVEFVRRFWNVPLASQRSDSLERCLRCLEQWEPSL